MIRMIYDALLIIFSFCIMCILYFLIVGYVIILKILIFIYIIIKSILKTTFKIVFKIFEHFKLFKILISNITKIKNFKIK